MDAARRSPVYALAKTYRIALPLHPEYRTMPMVWYVPPLSPVVDAISRDGPRRRGPDNLFGAIDALRIPIEYLAGLFTAGDTAVVDRGAQEAGRHARRTCGTSTWAVNRAPRSRRPSAWARS